MSDHNTLIEEEIIRLSHEWIEAVGRRDGDALDRILADDFLIAGWLPGGKLGDKQFYIEDCLRPVDVEHATFSYEQWKFRIYDAFVIANSVFKCHMLIAGKEWGNDGDLIVIDRAETVRVGSIVVARLNDEFVVKRFRMINDRPWLYPANDKYEPIEITEGADFEIWGCVTFAITSLFTNN